LTADRLLQTIRYAEVRCFQITSLSAKKKRAKEDRDILAAWECHMSAEGRAREVVC
jgi:hypothetical protein